MIKQLLIDYEEVRNLFNEEFKQTMQLIQAGETHLDNLAEGFTEADRVLFRLMMRRPQTKADRMIAMIQNGQVSDLLDWWQEIFEDGVPGDDYFAWWLKLPAKDGEGDG